MSLVGATLDLIRLVDPNTWEAVEVPPPGSAIGWGARFTFDNSPHTDPYGEHSNTTYVVSWDGKESRAHVEEGLVKFDGNGPVWPIRLDQWARSHGNVGAFVVFKKSEDAGRHKVAFWTENTQDGSPTVTSNRLEYEIS